MQCRSAWSVYTLWYSQSCLGLHAPPCFRFSLVSPQCRTSLPVLWSLSGQHCPAGGTESQTAPFKCICILKWKYTFAKRFETFNECRCMPWNIKYFVHYNHFKQGAFKLQYNTAPKKTHFRDNCRHGVHVVMRIFREDTIWEEWRMLSMRETASTYTQGLLVGAKGEVLCLSCFW